MKQATRLTEQHGVYISLLAALAVGVYAVTLGQDKNWDLLNYHLYNPFALFTGRLDLDHAPAGLQTWFSPMLDSVYFTAISTLSPKFVGFLLGALQGLNFLLIFKISCRVLADHAHRVIYALLMALAGILTVGFQAEIGTAMHDSLTALFPLCSMWLVLQAINLLDEPGQQRRVDLLMLSSGLVAGIGIALKLVTAIYALPLCLALLILPVGWLRRFRLSLIFGFSVLLGLFTLGGYWMLEVWQLTGNPLFPQFNHIFKGEMAPLEPIRDVRFLPKSLFDKLFYPVIFTMDPQRAAELKYEQYSWLTAYLAVAMLLITRIAAVFTKPRSEKRWSLKRSYLVAFFCISYFLWLNIFGIYRYLIIIEMLIPLLLFIIAAYIVNTRRTPVVAGFLIAILTVVNLPGAPDWGHAGWANRVYQVEDNALTEGPEPAAVYLAGQPVAWIIPAMNIRSPYIQVVPNFPVSEAYWERARMLASGRAGKAFIVFESEADSLRERAEHGMMKAGISVAEETCNPLVAYLGADRIQYRYCEIKKTEPN